MLFEMYNDEDMAKNGILQPPWSFSWKMYLQASSLLYVSQAFKVFSVINKQYNQ